MSILFDDPSNDHQINNKFFNGAALIAFKTTLADTDKQQLISLITILCMKLASLWLIKENYKSELSKIKSQLKESPKGGNDNLHSYSIHSSGLMGWLDVYLVQIKSILDHLVKIPSPIFGYKQWSLATFGKKGETVKKSFENLPKDYKKKTNNYYEYIFGSQHWIHDAIDMRDKLNHGIKGGLNLKMFELSYNQDLDKYQEPMWSQDQTINEALELIFDSMLKTSSIFCGLILSLKLPDDHTVICDPDKIPVCTLIPKEVLKHHLESYGMYDHKL